MTTIKNDDFDISKLPGNCQDRIQMHLKRLLKHILRMITESQDYLPP